MQIFLKSKDTRALDNAVKRLCCVGDVSNIKVLPKDRTNHLRRIVICSSIKVSVITQLELPEVVNISIKA
jgi:ribosomal protein S10